MGAPVTPPGVAPTLLTTAPSVDVFLARAAGSEPGADTGAFVGLPGDTARPEGLAAGARPRSAERPAVTRPPAAGQARSTAPGRPDPRAGTPGLGSTGPLRGREGQIIRPGQAGGSGALSASTLLTRATIEGRGDPGERPRSTTEAGQVQRAPVPDAPRTELSARDRGAPSTAATGRPASPAPSFAARSTGARGPTQGLRRPETASLSPGKRTPGKGREPGAVVPPAAAGKGEWSPQVLEFVSPPVRDEGDGDEAAPTQQPASASRTRPRRGRQARGRGAAPTRPSAPSPPKAKEEAWVEEEPEKEAPRGGRKAKPPSWRAPQARSHRPVQKQAVPAAAAPPQDRKALEEMAESELIQVLRGMTVRSPEARQLLKDIQKQIDEYWRIEELRRIS